MEILASMVKPKLTLFKMQIKSGFGHSAELCEAHFGNAPEIFNTFDNEQTY